MPLDYATLTMLRQSHPAWRLLRAQQAPLVAAFLHRVFIEPNVRSMAQADLAEALEDELYVLRERNGDDVFPGTALSYLHDWADDDKGWLRKFYPPGTDEPHYDLMPATEKVLAWLETLTARSFVGTESRLRTLFDLLRQMSEGSQTDPQVRIAELQRRRHDIDVEIARIQDGNVSVLDDTSVRDRFQQFLQLARELLTDFREVESNFRMLDRRVRERIALWDGAKGALLEDIMGQRDAIADSDQGKSFRAFWDFLMSQSRQEELSHLLEHVLSLGPVSDMQPDARLRRVHYDWLEAGEHTQRTIAKLSEQLRRFLDDKARHENRRIMNILQRIEQHAVAVRESMPSGAFTLMTETTADVELPLERPMYRQPATIKLSSIAIDHGDADVDLSSLYAQIVVDRAELARNIRQVLQQQPQASLADIVNQFPLRHGLAELVTYVQLAGDWPHAVVDDDVRDVITWQADDDIERQATMPRIILLRNP